MRIWHTIYSHSSTIEAVFQAWDEFIIGKKKKTDVVAFARFLEDNLFELHQNLQNKTYEHGGYKSFYIRDPKVRHISKACVKDRVVHHLASRLLEKIFDSTFYTHSYSCRREKGTLKAIEAFIRFSRKASKNNTFPLFALKCDIKKFFANVDHEILIKLLNKRIQDEDFLWLLKEIVSSFSSEFTTDLKFPKGMPIGNLTSQLFANIYLDPLDRYIKHELKVEYYIRYADDFIILSESREYLEGLITSIKEFLNSKLTLSLHPQKIEIKNYYLGVDFLGYVIFPHFVLPRTKTKRRIFKKIYQKVQLYKMNKISSGLLNQSVQSYLGYLGHANAYRLSLQLKNQVVF